MIHLPSFDVVRSEIDRQTVEKLHRQDSREIAFFIKSKDGPKSIKNCPKSNPGPSWGTPGVQAWIFIDLGMDSGTLLGTTRVESIHLGEGNRILHGLQ